MARDDLRVAVIGFGLGGRVFHAPLVAATPGLRVASIATGDPDRQHQARDRYPDAAVLDHADQLWSAGGDHDLVVITTPNASHVPLALAALDVGLPVVLDKPMAATVADAEAVAVEASRRGLLLTVFQNRRWDGDFLTVRRLVDDGAIGPVVRFESRFERWRPERNPAAWRERGDPAEGGGLLLDLGSHLVDQATVLFGPPVRVYAEVERRRAGAEVDDDTFIALEHRGGERSHLWCTVTARLLGPRFRVLGLNGAYEKHGLDPQEAALAAGGDPSQPGWGREPEDRWGTLADEDGERPVETEAGDYLAFYEGVAAALRDGAAPPVDLQDSITGLRVLEAAARSARNGSVEELDAVSALRWGVLSPAKIGTAKVIPATQAADRCEVTAIASRSEDRARAAADALGIPRSHGSYEALLADPEVDAVYIPLPNHLHAEWTIAAARAGKHVLCEKPMALTAADVERMVAACDDAGVLVMEAFMYRLHPSWVAVRELVASGRIGTLRAVDVWFSYFNDDPKNIRNILDTGGGALWDIGCYAVNVARMLFGSEPTRVEASIDRDPASGVDVLTAGLLGFDGGGTATFTCATRVEPDQRAHVYGSDGRIAVGIPFNIPPDRPTEVHVTHGGDPPVSPDTETLRFEPADQYRVQAEAFARAVLDGVPLPTPPADAVANVAVIERLFAGA